MGGEGPRNGSILQPLTRRAHINLRFCPHEVHFEPAEDSGTSKFLLQPLKTPQPRIYSAFIVSSVPPKGPFMSISTGGTHVGDTWGMGRFFYLGRPLQILIRDRAKKRRKGREKMEERVCWLESPFPNTRGRKGREKKVVLCLSSTNQTLTSCLARSG